MFLQVSVCPQGGRAWQGGMHGKGHAWLGGVCMAGGHAWQMGMCGRGHAWQGVCMAGGVHVGGHVWQGACIAGVCMVGGACHALPPANTTRYSDTVNERAVRILLECILVFEH